MYHQFYGLRRLPFDITPDPSLMYMSKGHREALASIICGVEGRRGFIVCTGDVGMGKTTVLRSYYHQVNRDSLKLIYVFTPKMTPVEMTRYLCRELGADVPLRGFATIQTLQLKLLENFVGNKTVVLIVDEAQTLTRAMLEHLRLLSNFETNCEKLIQIILFGQTELEDTLARPDMRQLSQRISLHTRLEPFSDEESISYMEHRLVRTGADCLEQVLTSGAAEAIARAADGIPRRINTLADNVLIAGYGCEQRPVGRRLASRTVKECLAHTAMRKGRGGLFCWLR
jgi:general secretion pathway protein A